MPGRSCVYLHDVDEGGTERKKSWMALTIIEVNKQHGNRVGGCGGGGVCLTSIEVQSQDGEMSAVPPHTGST